MASLMLLANFYGIYLDPKKFKSTKIVNNAGIEQLGTVAIEEVKRLRGEHSAVYVLIVAGLTDVLIKSVEQGKNKLEITPNSIQLIETKMKWASQVLTQHGATVIWAIMPPISLQMYHESEGWNVSRIPGMTPGLQKEQQQLNDLMDSYRDLCIQSNKSQNLPTLYLTTKVAESGKNGRSILNTQLFDNDGITPTKNLIAIWDKEMDVFLTKIHRFNQSALKKGQAERKRPRSNAFNYTEPSDATVAPIPPVDRDGLTAQRGVFSDQRVEDGVDRKRRRLSNECSSSGGLLSLGSQFTFSGGDNEHKPDQKNDRIFSAEQERPYSHGEGKQFATGQDRQFNKVLDYAAKPRQERTFRAGQDNLFHTGKERTFNTSQEDSFSSTQSRPFNSVNDRVFNVGSEHAFARRQERLFPNGQERLTNTAQDRKHSSPTRISKSRFDNSGLSRNDNIPSLLTMNTKQGNQSVLNPQQQGVQELLRAVQNQTASNQQNVVADPQVLSWLQSALQLGPSNNSIPVMLAVLAQQKALQEQEKRKQEEEQRERLLTQQRLEEQQRLKALQKQAEEQTRKEILRKAEEQRLFQKRQAEIVAREQKAQQERLRLVQQQMQQAKLAEQQAKLRVQEHSGQATKDGQPTKGQPTKGRCNGVADSSSDALDRLNAKLRQGRETESIDSSTAGTSNQANVIKVAPAPKILKPDPDYAKPVVLFSYVNRNHLLRPLKGIRGRKPKYREVIDNRSKGVLVYAEKEASSPSLGLFKVSVRRQGTMTEFEQKVAKFNNDFLALQERAAALIEEAAQKTYGLFIESSQPARVGKKSVQPKQEGCDAAIEDARGTGDPEPDANSANVQEHPNQSRKKKKQPNSTGIDPSNSDAKVDVVAEANSTPSKAKNRWDDSDSEEELLWDEDAVIDPLQSLDDEEENAANDASGQEKPHTESSTQVLISDDMDLEQDHIAESKNDEPDFPDEGFLVIDEAPDDRFSDNLPSPNDVVEQQDISKEDNKDDQAGAANHADSVS